MPPLLNLNARKQWMVQSNMGDGLEGLGVHVFVTMRKHQQVFMIVDGIVVAYGHVLKLSPTKEWDGLLKNILTIP